MRPNSRFHTKVLAVHGLITEIDVKSKPSTLARGDRIFVPESKPKPKVKGLDQSPSPDSGRVQTSAMKEAVKGGLLPHMQDDHPGVPWLRKENQSVHNHVHLTKPYLHLDSCPNSMAVRFR
jgi:hypothetical protein